MRKGLLFILYAILLCAGSLGANGQDCDVLVQKRKVPGTRTYVYATSYYTMNASSGTVAVSALTADGAVAIVFQLFRFGKRCFDLESKIQVRFTNNDNVVMTNGDKNCDSNLAIYFSEGLNNMALLSLFRTQKIRFVKIWFSNGRTAKIKFTDGIAYNVRKSMDCLANMMNAPITVLPENERIMDSDSLIVKRMFSRGKLVEHMGDYSNVKHKMSPPVFEGGDKALRTFFGKNMHTHSVVDRGVVVVAFKVDKEGNVTSPRVVLGVSETVDKEAQRLVSMLPKWKPALKDGEPIEANVKVHIAF